MPHCLLGSSPERSYFNLGISSITPFHWVNDTDSCDTESCETDSWDTDSCDTGSCETTVIHNVNHANLFSNRNCMFYDLN